MYVDWLCVAGEYILRVNEWCVSGMEVIEWRKGDLIRILRKILPDFGRRVAGPMGERAYKKILPNFKVEYLCIPMIMGTSHRHGMRNLYKPPNLPYCYAK